MLLTADHLTPDELAERWHMSPRTLANYRSLGNGPGFVKLGRRILYRLDDVIAYEESRYVPAAA